MIRFGSSGWRGLIAEEVTVGSVRDAAVAIARHLRAAGRVRRGVFVGHDTRFLSERFAEETARVLLSQGIPVTCSTGAVPTPAVAYAVAAGRREAGISVTAGHHPPEFSGFSLMVKGGAPAPAEALLDVERRASTAPAKPGRALPSSARRRSAAARRLDVRAGYFRHLGRTVRLTAIRRARLRVACDMRHGAAIGYLDGVLDKVARRVEALHDTPHPEFGGIGPDCSEPHLAPLARAVRRGGHDLGLATDGDGDRFGIVDAGGGFVPPSHFLALLADYLIGERGLEGAVGRTVATTHLLDAVCALHGRVLHETPVGFRHLAERLVSRETFLACEEGGGLAVASHLPQKDGILAGLLAAEMVAVRRRPLREQVRTLLDRIGPLHGRRIDYHTDAAARDRFLRRLETPPSIFAGRRIARIDETDGRRMTFGDGSWILIRPSSTMSLVRCYIEGRSPRDLDDLTAAARDLITKE
jgi:phosphomannomutase